MSDILTNFQFLAKKKRAKSFAFCPLFLFTLNFYVKILLMDKNSKIYKIRHSFSHLLAIAILEKFPDAKIVSGPPTETGFFYGVDFGKEKVEEKDLKDFQKKIKKLISQNLAFIKEEKTKEELLEFYKNNEYKKEITEDKAKDGKPLTIYKTGENFFDLCSGPHVEHSADLPIDSFRIDKISGAYFKADEKRPMLTRIYGTAFETKEGLENHDKMLKEAEKRDHRKIGKKLDLFTFSDLVGSGLPLFTPKGTLMRNLITEEIEKIQKNFGWQKVTIPHITKKDLYEKSGHWEKFGDELFKVSGKTDQEFVMKPMNCPHHTQIYSANPRSYKDLPLRFSENGVVYRDEQQGELLGISRVRAITQDDGHSFCTPEQVEEEISNIILIIKKFYTKFEMFDEKNLSVSLSISDPKKPEKYMLEDGLFKKAEEILEKIAIKENLPYKKIEGEAAFYGPKLDFHFKDALGRSWQLATAQLDFSMPKRFDLLYTDSDGQKKNPVMIHRAIAGSLERFMSVMIEHFAGEFPFWLCPVQVSVIPIAENLNQKAKEITKFLEENNFRVESDYSKESFGKKVRSAKEQKIPYFIIVGERDPEGKFTLESRDSEEKLVLTPEEILEKFEKEN